MSVGSMLLKYRQKARISQASFATYMNKTPSSVGSWERGGSEPCIRDIRKLCKWYDITPNQLFEWHSEDDAMREIYLIVKDRI